MALSSGNWQRQDIRQTLRVDPRLILQRQLLALNQDELEQAIDTELAENPALERLEERETPDSDSILKSVAPQELIPTSDNWETVRSLSDDGDVNWLDLVPSETTLEQKLHASFVLSLPEELRELGEWLVADLDHRGYLATPVEEIALILSRSIEEVETALASLQQQEPKGIGARELKECLLLQVSGQGPVENLARELIAHHLTELRTCKPERFSRMYRVLPAVVKASIQLIFSLDPCPAEKYERDSCVGRQAKHPPIRADLIITRDLGGFHIEVPGIAANGLRIDRYYAKRLTTAKPFSKPDRAEHKSEMTHVRTFVDRAERFIEAVAKRGTTMTEIGNYLVRHQSGFLATGDSRFLNSSSQKRMAEELGLDDSAISRAIRGKFVMIPTGETVPFSIFFKPSLRIQRIIQEILQNENPDNPLSDDAISQMLAEQGIVVARRTVNKYRDRTKLLSSRRRRVA